MNPATPSRRMLAAVLFWLGVATSVSAAASGDVLWSAPTRAADTVSSNEGPGVFEKQDSRTALRIEKATGRDRLCGRPTFRRRRCAENGFTCPPT